ncbi:hypothetical protein [Chelatococcus sp.]|uniref:hypothetical protein n=1 Tax=Chelatococcus sp. TaxID=1953771 RepID=UPI001EC9CDEE|nr:hypothetical protein [Chelatococcus sp.]MBX3547314.1 hypothetical protein [Chelatococcus sp.]CAH1677905.1 Exonuclease SbcC [Hyphomicrobiales bacterium]
MDGLTNTSPGDAAAEIDKLIAGGDDDLTIPDLGEVQGGDDEIEIVDTPEVAPAKAAEAELEPTTNAPTLDDAAEALKAQLAERDRQIAALQAERDTVKKTAWEEKLDGTKAVLSGALEGIKGDIANAKREMREAMENGDYDKVTDLSERIGVLGVNRTRVEEGLSQVDSEIDRAKKAHVQTQRQPQTQDEFIDAHIANSTPATATWLRGNRDFFSDPKKHARVMSAHHAAIADGITPQADETAYWKYIDGKLGGNPKAEEPKKASPSPITAPSSRSAPSPSGTNTGGKITLTRAEVEMAQSLGMTNKEYAFYKASEAKKALN